MQLLHYPDEVFSIKHHRQVSTIIRSVQMKHAVLSTQLFSCGGEGGLLFLLEHKLYFESPSITGFLYPFFFLFFLIAVVRRLGCDLASED